MELHREGSASAACAAGLFCCYLHVTVYSFKSSFLVKVSIIKKVLFEMQQKGISDCKLKEKPKKSVLNKVLKKLTNIYQCQKLSLGARIEPA